MASKRKLPSGLWEAIWSVYVDGERKQRRRRFATAAAARQHATLMEMQEQRGIGTVRLSLGEYSISGCKRRNVKSALIRWRVTAVGSHTPSAVQWRHCLSIVLARSIWNAFTNIWRPNRPGEAVRWRRCPSGTLPVCSPTHSMTRFD